MVDARHVFYTQADVYLFKFCIITLQVYVFGFVYIAIVIILWLVYDLGQFQLPVFVFSARYWSYGFVSRANFRRKQLGAMIPYNWYGPSVVGRIENDCNLMCYSEVDMAQATRFLGAPNKIFAIHS